MFERLLEEERIEHRVIEFSSGNSLRGCLLRGIGVSLCPRISISRELRDGTLLALEWPEISTSVIMIRHVDKWCSPLVARFMDIAGNLIC